MQYVTRTVTVTVFVPVTVCDWQGRSQWQCLTGTDCPRDCVTDTVCDRQGQSQWQCLTGTDCPRDCVTDTVSVWLTLWQGLSKWVCDWHWLSQGLTVTVSVWLTRTIPVTNSLRDCLTDRQWQCVLDMDCHNDSVWLSQGLFDWRRQWQCVLDMDCHSDSVWLALTVPVTVCDWHWLSQWVCDWHWLCVIDMECPSNCVIDMDWTHDWDKLQWKCLDDQEYPSNSVWLNTGNTT